MKKAENLTQVISFRIRNPDKDKFEKLCKALGQDKSNFLRKRIINVINELKL
jgi:predicted DNA-binding protein